MTTQRQDTASRRTQRLARLGTRLDAWSGRLAGVRLACAAIALGLLAASAAWPARQVVLVAVAAPFALAFAILVAWHRRAKSRGELVAAVHAGACLELLRAEGRLRELPRDGQDVVPASALVTDLSVAGPFSLFQLVSRAATPEGEAALGAALARDRALPDIPERQAAVRELAPLVAFRARLEGLGATRRAPPRGAVGLAEAVQQGQSIHDEKPWLRPLAWGLHLVAFAALAAWAVADETTFLVPALLAPAALFAVHAGRFEQDYEHLLPLEDSLASRAAMLAFVERRRFSAAPLQRLQAAFTAGAAPASRQLRALAGLLAWLSLKHSSLHVVVNALVPWDLECTATLRRWRKAAGERVPTWTAALGELEALSSLAGHAQGLAVEARDGHAWCFPGVAEGGAFLEAQGLTHPLLPRERAVGNDVRLDGPGAVMLLTGSNMSGKSTLLRTLGASAVLSFAGGAVPARSLRLVPCRLASSIHVSDALDQGVSQFHAEVLRLKSMLDAVEEAQQGGGALPVLYLVDEILRGTNTRERLLASRFVIRRLAHSTSAGFVTSHDISLATLAAELPGLVNAHFRESVTGGRMTFDYTLRPGPVTTSNALEVLRLAGIDVPRED